MFADGSFRCVSGEGTDLSVRGISRKLQSPPLLSNFTYIAPPFTQLQLIIDNLQLIIEKNSYLLAREAPLAARSAF